MQRLLLALIFAVFVSGTFGQTVTWNADIAPIVFENCSNCHHDGGIAPMSINNYAEAYSWRNEIGDYVAEGTMPPWPADENYVHFKDERVLSAEQKDKIAAWVADGAPKGTGTEPTAPVFTDGILMTDYDASIDLPEYTITSDVDQYRTFVIHSDLTSTKYINAREFIPDNAAVIHHMLIYQDTSDISWNLDQADPGPGYASNGTTSGSPYATLIGAWAPGDNIYELPAGMGIEVPAGSDFAIEIHFAPGHLGESAAPQLHLKWSQTAFTRPVWVNPILYHFAPVFQEPSFYIPANTIQTFHEIYSDDTYLNVDLSLISAAPHMHYLGQTYRAYAKTPTDDSIPLIYIDNWDFHWQYGYTFQKLLKIPAFTDFYGIATYDNTASNPDNPNDPPVDVYLGEQTTDEMMLCFFAYTFYLPGDENIILDSSLVTGISVNTIPTNAFQLYPNPADKFIHIIDQHPDEMELSISIYDVTGKQVLIEQLPDEPLSTLDISTLASGIYTIHINSGDRIFNSQLVKYR